MDALQEFMKRFADPSLLEKGIGSDLKSVSNFASKADSNFDMANIDQMLKTTNNKIASLNEPKQSFLNNPDTKNLMMDGLLGGAAGLATMFGSGADTEDKTKAALAGVKNAAAASNPYIAAGKMVSDTGMAISGAVGGENGAIIG